MTQSPSHGVGGIGRRFVERSPNTWSLEREQLLQRKIADLGLKIEGSALERCVKRLYQELAAAGIEWQPRVYLSDEWSCPDGVPLIGVPFYLVDSKLMQIEDEMMDGVEASTEEEIVRYLRHEAGHAFNYAFKLYTTEPWQQLFGDFFAPYHDEYIPQPFSRRFVRHIAGWYAQKHPDEDFAETFAVWLDPQSSWREVYAGWGALAKLEYVDDIARQLGHRLPPVTGLDYDLAREATNERSVREHYEQTKPAPTEITVNLDQELRQVFARASGHAHEDGLPAHQLLVRHRRVIVNQIAYWTGLYDVHVRSLVEHLIERARTLDLRVDHDDEPRALIRFVALVSALCMNRLQRGDFVVQ